MPNEKDAYILDIGCGEGAFLLWLKRCGYKNLFGFDLSESAVKLAHSFGLDFVIVCDALKIKEFLHGIYFDLIVAIDLIEHIPKDKVDIFLEGIYHKLKVGGKVLIQTPNLGSIIGVFMRYNDFTHEFGLTEKSVIDILIKAGFKLENISVFPSWNATTFLGYCREIYLRFLHKIIFYADDRSRPKIPTKNLIAVAKK